MDPQQPDPPKPQPSTSSSPAPRRASVEPVQAYGAAAGESNTRLVTLALVTFTVAMLYLAREVLVPMALGALLSFLLAIPAARLEKLGLSRVWAAVVVAVFAFTCIGGLGYMIGRQVIDLAGRLPQYQQNLSQKIDSLRPNKTGTIAQVRKTLTELGEELTDDNEAATSASAAATKRTGPPSGWDAPRNNPASAAVPTPVKVVQTERSSIEVLRSYVGPLLARIGAAGIVVVFVLFMLIERENLRDRIVRLAGQRRITVTTQALDEAAARVSRYLLMQVIINVTYGIPVALGLWLIGLPNYLLWGLLATLLRFIPYIGPWMAATLPIGLALAVFDSWGPVMMVLGLFLVLELLSNNVMEPLLYGHSTGLTPFAVLVSAVFWTWLWGTVGLFMATPLTVCLVVIGRYVPQLHFLEVLLGDTPVLSAAERLYQRLLGMDMEDSQELLEEERKGRTLLEVFDDLLLPALAMAERDRHRGTLIGRRAEFTMTALELMVEESVGEPDSTPAMLLKPRSDDKTEQEDEADQLREALRTTADGLPHEEGRLGTPASPYPDKKGPSASVFGLKVLVMAARDDADDLAARMLAFVLSREGALCTVIPSSRIGVDAIEQASHEAADVLVVSAMPPLAISSARLLAKRLRVQNRDTRLIVALWRAEGGMQQCTERLQSAKPDALVTTLQDALSRIPIPPPAQAAGQQIEEGRPAA